MIVFFVLPRLFPGVEVLFLSGFESVRIGNREMSLTRLKLLRRFSPGNEHLFLKKPWCIYSNSGRTYLIFSKFVCPGVSTEHEHDQRSGLVLRGVSGTLMCLLCLLTVLSVLSFDFCDLREQL